MATSVAASVLPPVLAARPQQRSLLTMPSRLAGTCTTPEKFGRRPRTRRAQLAAPSTCCPCARTRRARPHRFVGCNNGYAENASRNRKSASGLWSTRSPIARRRRRSAPSDARPVACPKMIHALLPVYLVAVLGTSALTVGIIEGIAEATASIIKVFSGALSDWMGKRKFLAAHCAATAGFSKVKLQVLTNRRQAIGTVFLSAPGLRILDSDQYSGWSGRYIVKYRRQTIP
jgi:hypothetical protein